MGILETILARLDEIVALLKGKGEPPKVNPLADYVEMLKEKSQQPPIQLPNPWAPSLDRCPKCHLSLMGPTWYVCPNYPCPVGLGGVQCGSLIQPISSVGVTQINGQVSCNVAGCTICNPN